ncbi:hypothetical protein V1509DRAFT_637293 [Lipomyces kononenkoae]
MTLGEPRTRRGRSFLTLMANTASFTEDSLLPLAISTCSGSEASAIYVSRSMWEYANSNAQFIQPNARKRRQQIQLMLLNFLKRSYIPRQSVVPRREPVQTCGREKQQRSKFGAIFQSFKRTPVWRSRERKNRACRNPHSATRPLAFSMRRCRRESFGLSTPEQAEVPQQDILVASTPNSVKLHIREGRPESSVLTTISISDVASETPSPCARNIANDRPATTASANAAKNVRFHPTRAHETSSALRRIFHAGAKSRSSSGGYIDESESTTSPSTAVPGPVWSENSSDINSSTNTSSKGTVRDRESVYSSSSMQNRFRQSHIISAAGSINFISVRRLRGSLSDIDSFDLERELEFAPRNSSEENSVSTNCDPRIDGQLAMSRGMTEYDCRCSAPSAQTPCTTLSTDSIGFFAAETSPRTFADINAGPDQLYHLVRLTIRSSSVSMTSDVSGPSIGHDYVSDNDTNGKSMFRGSSLRSSIFSALGPNIADLRALICEDKELDHCYQDMSERVAVELYGDTKGINSTHNVSEPETVGLSERHISLVVHRAELIRPLDVPAPEDGEFMTFEDISLIPQTESERDNNSVESVTQTKDLFSSGRGVSFKQRVYNMVDSFTRTNYHHSESACNVTDTSQIDLQDEDFDESNNDESITKVVKILSAKA